MTYTYAELYVKRFTVTLCSEKLVTTHNISPRIREDLGAQACYTSCCFLKGFYKDFQFGGIWDGVHCPPAAEGFWLSDKGKGDWEWGGGGGGGGGD